METKDSDTEKDYLQRAERETCPAEMDVLLICWMEDKALMSFYSDKRTLKQETCL